MFWKKDKEEQAATASGSKEAAAAETKKPCCSGKKQAAEEPAKQETQQQEAQQQQQQKDDEPQLSAFEFGGSLKSGMLGMTGICPSQDPNVIQACTWSPEPARSGSQKQRFSVFF